MALVLLAPGGRDPGFGVVSGVIRARLVGAWTADLLVDAETAPAGAAEIRVGQVARLKGTVARAKVYEGMVRMRVVAGGGGLDKALEPRHFTTPSIRVVLSEILRQAGEVLAASADAALLAQVLEHWTIRRMAAARAIRLLLDRAGADVNWRILDDGTLWVGKEAWPDSKLGSVSVVGETPEDDVAELALAVPYVPVGTLVAGRKVDSAETRITGSEVRSTVWARL